MASIVEANGKKYWEDEKGSLVCVENIVAQDKKKDALVEKLLKKAEKLSKILAETKAKMTEEITNYLETEAESFGTNWKGNTQLKSFNGKMMVMVKIQDFISFDEKLQIAKALIDECVNDWSKDTPELGTLISKAFETDKKGNLNKAFILKLRRLKINVRTKKEEWDRAMDLISESIQIDTAKTYYSFRKKDESGEFETILLDFASL